MYKRQALAGAQLVHERAEQAGGHHDGGVVVTEGLRGDGGGGVLLGEGTGHALSLIHILSGMPMVAELANPGAPMRSSSISRAEMFSPPRMMTSFLRPLMRMRPRCV